MTHQVRQHLLFGIAFVAFSSCGGGGFVRDAYDGGPRDGDIFTPVASGYVISNSDSSPAGSTVAAAFWRDSGSCKPTVIGPCQTVCTPTPSAYDSAGAIEITGGMKMVTLTPGDNGTYQGYSDTSPLWSGGTMLTISAGGAAVPGFNGTVGTPDVVTVSAPSGTSINVPRTKPLAFAWTGGTTGEVKVSIVTGATGLVCQFPVSGHSASVPASALNLLPAGAGTIDVSVEESTQVTVGEYDVKLSSVTHAVAPAGGFAQFVATLQ